MAVIQAILTGIARSAGKILNTMFGWATILLFGKVPKDKQIYLSVISFGSILWVVAVVGIAFPSAGTFLLALLPLPEWVNENWVRLAMLAAALLIPAFTGFISLKLADSDNQSPQSTMKVIGRGYLFTLGLAVTLVLMMFLAPLIKLRSVSRRWATEHIPIVVEPEDYDEVVNEVKAAFAASGWETEKQPVTWMIRAPTRVLTFFSGDAAGSVIADRLVTLGSNELEIMLHPSDMVISGKPLEVTHARAAMMEQLAFSRAYLTWDKDANALEDRLREVWDSLKVGQHGSIPPDSVRALVRIEEDLRNADLPYEEWEVLYRAKLLADKRVLQMAARVVDRPIEPTDTPAEETGSAQMAESWIAAPGGWLARAGTAAALGILAWLGMKGDGSPDRSR